MLDEIKEDTNKLLNSFKESTIKQLNTVRKKVQDVKGDFL